MPKVIVMNASDLLRTITEHEMVMWMRAGQGWVRDVELGAAMDLSRAELADIRAPLARRGFIETCVGASRLTDYGREHAGDLLAELLAGEPLDLPVDGANEDL